VSKFRGLDQEVLRRFARLRGSGEGKLLLVVLDRAGWHVSGRVEVPEGVGLVFLPPYAPELQPVERVWPLVDAVVANGRVEMEGELWEKVEARCAYLQTQPGRVSILILSCLWTYAASTCTGNRGLKSRLSLPAMSLRRHW
jgi:hypothetical protein